MSFFDFIENSQDQAPELVTIPGKGATVGSNNQDQQRQTGQRPKQPKPERLKFLKPCPVCQGTEFTHHSSNGGFFCNTCQPGIQGSPALATGTRQPPETVVGLPCAGCKSTTYTKIENGFIFDDGTLADGWHCGGKNCHIKLLTGNKKADRATKKQALVKPKTDQTTQGRQQKEYFLAAFPWIMAHLPELQAAGWTRPALFRRSRYRWPGGPWGVAWLSVWSKPDLEVTIDGKTGAIRFTFTGTHGALVTQTVRPDR